MKAQEVKQALEHCIKGECSNCPNVEELGSGETVCVGRLLPKVLDCIADLEAKLAEKEADNYRLQQRVDTFIGAKLNKMIDDYEQQLAEKEKEIETMKKDSDKNIDYLVEFASLIENEKDCNRMLKALDRVKRGNKYLIDKDHNQDKIELLEHIIDIASNCWDVGTDNAVFLYDDFIDEINGIIKEIKGE